MMHRMRTTVNIQDELLTETRARAVRGRKTLGSVIEDALQALFIERPNETHTWARVVLPTGGGSGLQPRVALED